MRDNILFFYRMRLALFLYVLSLAVLIAAFLAWHRRRVAMLRSQWHEEAFAAQLARDATVRRLTAERDAAIEAQEKAEAARLKNDSGNGRNSGE